MMNVNIECDCPVCDPRGRLHTPNLHHISSEPNMARSGVMSACGPGGVRVYRWQRSEGEPPFCAGPPASRSRRAACTQQPTFRGGYSWRFSRLGRHLEKGGGFRTQGRTLALCGCTPVVKYSSHPCLDGPAQRHVQVPMTTAHHTCTSRGESGGSTSHGWHGQMGAGRIQRQEGSTRGHVVVCDPAGALAASGDDQRVNASTGRAAQYRFAILILTRAQGAILSGSPMSDAIGAGHIGGLRCSGVNSEEWGALCRRLCP